MINDIYDVVKQEFEGFDAIYEDAIIRIIGVFGLGMLLKHKLIETCGVINGRQLYALCKNPREIHVL